MLFVFARCGEQCSGKMQGAWSFPACRPLLLKSTDLAICCIRFLPFLHVLTCCTIERRSVQISAVASHRSTRLFLCTCAMQQELLTKQLMPPFSCRTGLTICVNATSPQVSSTFGCSRLRKQ